MRYGAIEITSYYYNGSAQFCYSTSPESSMVPRHTTQHPSCKNCTGFSLQNASSTELHACTSTLWFYKWSWSFLHCWTATCLHSVPHVSLLFWCLHTQHPTMQMHMAITFFPLLWTLSLELTGKQTDPGANLLWPTFIWNNYALCQLVIQTPTFILHSTHLLITNTGPKWLLWAM